MHKVRDGHFAFGLTDTDDFNVAREEGFPVAVVYPDQGEGELGTLLIPNTVAILADAPHPEAARQLVDFILSREVEERLAHARGAQIPRARRRAAPAARQGPGRLPRDARSTTARSAASSSARQAELEELFVD